MKNNSWKDKRPALWERNRYRRCNLCHVLMYRADLRAAAIPKATGADDRHAQERNVRNDEMSNWMWIDVGLVITGDGQVALPRASSQTVVVGERGWRRTKSASARWLESGGACGWAVVQLIMTKRWGRCMGCTVQRRQNTKSSAQSRGRS